MDISLERFRNVAERALEEGCIRDIDFSGSTYQIEFYDSEKEKSYWPFLQVDAQGRVNDAFCSCAAEEEEQNKCIHLAAAYLKILGGTKYPLHVRFEHSFWNYLCRLVADHTGYDERVLLKKGEGHYLYTNEVRFEIEALSQESRDKLTKWIENRPRETPENSIKFSNISQEEIAWWREGRPSPNLRYALSFWSDLAKWMMSFNHQGRVTFAEDVEGLPTRLDINFPMFKARFEINKRDLPKLIASIEGINSSLKVFQSADEKVQNILFEPSEPAFYIEHAPLPAAKVKGALRPIGL